jgi:hypothetical protein
MMLLTFLEAKNIRRHKARFPNKDLKLRAGLLRDRVSDSTNEAFGWEVELSKFTDFLVLCLALAATGGVEEEEEEEEES